MSIVKFYVKIMEYESGITGITKIFIIFILMYFKM